MPRLVALAFALLAAAPACADYYLPPPDEQIHLFASRWELKTTQGSECVTHGEERMILAVTLYSLHVEHEGKSYEWPIDLFWLADRIDSDSICTGGHEPKMRRYLDELGKVEPGTPVRFELVRARGRKDLMVAGVWAHDAAREFERAGAHGSEWLKKSPEEVKALGSAEAFSRALEEASAAGWKRLVEIAAAGDDARWLLPGVCGDEESKQAHRAENCIVKDWECPRCGGTVHSLVWSVCEKCAADLSMCLECRKKKSK